MNHYTKEVYYHIIVTRVHGITRNASARRRNADGFIAKDLLLLFEMHDIRFGGMPWPHTGANNYHSQFGLPEKGRAINWLVVCYVVWLGSMKGMSVKTCARCVGLVPCCGQIGYRAQVPQRITSASSSD